MATPYINSTKNCNLDRYNTDALRMETKPEIIKTETQYWDYCNRLEELVMQESDDLEVAEEVDLLTRLIEKWDEEHDTFGKIFINASQFIY